MDTDEHGFKMGANCRQVLECGSPLPLFRGAAIVPKRQWTGAVQDASEFFLAGDFIRVYRCSPVVKNLLEKIKTQFAGKAKPEHLRRGELGQRAAKRHLQKLGLRFLTANFRSARGEIDLIFRDGDCLAFVEVKARSSEDWTRPAAAVDAERRRRLSRAALDYLRLLKNPPVKIRFDIVEVLLTDGEVREIRHLPNTFVLSKPYRYG
jgi:putative endonuclease